MSSILGGLLMRASRFLLSLFLALAIVPVFTPVTANAQIDIYITEGEHNVNGRQWRTSCEPYSATERCRTEIFATQVSENNGVFTQTNAWVFNNLTYAPSPRSLWEGNPIAGNGEVGGKVSWTAADGRKWRTECDTPTTGNGGCRSYIQASVIEATRDSSGNTRYQWSTKEILNNMVRFTSPPPASNPAPTVRPSPTVTPGPTVTPRPTVTPGPTAKPTPPVTPPPSIEPTPTTKPTAEPPVPGELSFIEDAGLRACIGERNADEITSLYCAHDVAISTLNGLERLPNLTHITLHWVLLEDISALSFMPQLQEVDLRWNEIVDVSPLAALSGLRSLLLEGNENITNINSLDPLLAADVEIDIHLPYPTEPLELTRIKDANLLACIQEEAGIGNALSLSPTEIVAFTSLNCAGRGIITLEGFPLTHHLVTLDLRDNTIKSVAPLSQHKRLHEVNLLGNPVKDLLSVDGLRWGGWANDLQTARADASPLAHAEAICGPETYLGGTGYLARAGSLSSSYLYQGVDRSYVVQTNTDTCEETVRYPVGWPDVAGDPWSITAHGFVRLVSTGNHHRLELTGWGGATSLLHEFTDNSSALWGALPESTVVVVNDEMLTLDRDALVTRRTELPHAAGLDPQTWTVLNTGDIQYWAEAADGTGQLCRATGGSPFSCQPVHSSAIQSPNPGACEYPTATRAGTYWRMYCGEGPYWVGYSATAAEPLHLPDLEYVKVEMARDGLLYYVGINDGGLYRLIDSGPELVEESLPI